MNGAWQPVRDAVDADLPLGHRLQQRRLRLGRGAVDLVGQQQVGEDRPVPELETARLHVVDGRAEQVGGQQVGGELDPREVQAQRRGERPRDERLAEAGQILDQDVPAGQHGGEDERQRRAPAHHHPLDLVEHGFAVGSRRGGCLGMFGHIRSNRSSTSLSTARPGPGCSPPVRSHVVRVDPRPEFGAEDHQGRGVECARILGLSLPGGQLELAGEHGPQVLVPVRAAGFRSLDQGLGPGQPAPQGLRGIAGDRLVDRGLRVALQQPAHGQQREHRRRTDHPRHQPAIRQPKGQPRDGGEQADARDDELRHALLPTSAAGRVFRSSSRTCCSTRDRGVAVGLGHHVRAEPRLVEQVDQLRRTVRSEGVVCDRAGQHLGGGVEVLGHGVGHPGQFAFHRRITRDDRPARFAAQILDLGEAHFGCAEEGFGCDVGCDRVLVGVGGGAGATPRRRLREATMVPTTRMTRNATVAP